ATNIIRTIVCFAPYTVSGFRIYILLLDLPGNLINIALKTNSFIGKNIDNKILDPLFIKTVHLHDIVDDRLTGYLITKTLEIALVKTHIIRVAFIQAHLIEFLHISFELTVG